MLKKQHKMKEAFDCWKEKVQGRIYQESHKNYYYYVLESVSVETACQDNH